MSEPSDPPPPKKIKIPSRTKRGHAPGQLNYGAHVQIKSAASNERAREALELRKTRMTYAKIGEALGVSTQSAWRYVKEAIDEIPREAAEETKQIEVEDCYADLNAVNKRIAIREQCEECGCIQLSPTELFKAVTSKVRLREQLAKYLGHYAPVRAEITGRDGAPFALSTTDVQGMTDDQLDRAIDAALGRGTSDAARTRAAPATSEEASRTRRDH